VSAQIKRRTPEPGLTTKERIKVAQIKRDGCSACGATPTYYYVDDTNEAITKGSRPLCRKHYESRHGQMDEFRFPWRDEDLYRMSDAGVLGVHNLLSSGDYEHRDAARARFVIKCRSKRPEES